MQVAIGYERDIIILGLDNSQRFLVITKGAYEVQTSRKINCTL